MVWEERTEELEIKESGAGLNIGSKIARFFGIIGLIISSIVILTMLSEPSISLGFAIIGFLFSMVFFLLPTLYKDANLKSNVILNSRDLVLECFTEDRSRAIKIPYRNFKNIYLERVARNRESSTALRYSYSIYLRMKDGAYFWLDSLWDQETAVESINKLLKYIDIPVRSSENIYPEKTSKKDYGNFDFFDPGIEPSKFVQIKPKGAGYELNIVNTFSSTTIFLLLCVFAIFFGTPFLILANAFSVSSFDPILFFLVPFVLIFISIVFIAFLMITRSFQVYCDSMQVQVRMHFPLFFDKIFNKEVTIPSHKIKYIQVNRLEMGNIWLSLEVEQDFSFDSLGLFYYLFTLTSNVVPGTRGFSGKNKTLGIWNISFMNKEGLAATYKDALYLEHFLQRQLNLIEKEIED